jgi:menaquinone-dependent protoporphyrinogen oxidase
MDNRVLVAYATKYGATAEIAKKIGEVLRLEGLVTDVLPVDDVGDLAPYEAVVLGSAVYIGKWRKEAVKFLERNEKLLAKKQVWLFSSGPTGEGDAEELLQGWHFPSGQQPNADRIQPRDIVVFHGELNINRLNFIERTMIKNVKAAVGDYRDFNAITAWATEIAVVLTETDRAPG